MNRHERRRAQAVNRGKSGRVPECACPACGRLLDAFTSVGGHYDPSPGSLTVCIYCGALLMFDESLKLSKLEAIPEDADAETVALIERVRAAVASARAEEGAQSPEGYNLTCSATVEAVRLWLNQHPTPLFGYPPDEIALSGSLADIGHRLARNASAHGLIDSLLELRDACELLDHPTAIMLRMALDRFKIKCEVVGLSDLGLSPIGGGGGVN